MRAAYSFLACCRDHILASEQKKHCFLFSQMQNQMATTIFKTMNSDQPEQETPQAEDIRVTAVPVMKTTPSDGRARGGLLAELNAKRLWMLIACILAITTIASPIVMTILLTKPQLIIALDGANNFHIGPSAELESSKEIMSTHALLSCMALLQRSAAGFDMPELLKQIFNIASTEKANKELQKDMADIKTRNERWRPEVTKVEMIKMDQANLFTIRVAGILIKNGIAAGAFFESTQNFTLILKLIKNPRLTQNARYPLVVYDYELRLEASTGGPGMKPAASAAAAQLSPEESDARQKLMDTLTKTKRP